MAQSVADDRFYAVERVQYGIYALCRLGLWVTLELLQSLQTGATSCSWEQRPQIKEPLRIPKDRWWRGAVIEPEPKVLYHVSSAQKAPGIRLCLQKPVNTTRSPMLLAVQEQSDKSPEEAGCSLDGMIEETAQELEETLAMIRSQYQESLYASKVSFCHCTILRMITNFIQRPHWRTSPRDLYPELVRLSTPRMALAVTKLIL